MLIEAGVSPLDESANEQDGGSFGVEREGDAPHAAIGGDKSGVSSGRFYNAKSVWN